MQDARESSRTSIELEIEYRELNRFFADYTRDLSKGGAFVRTSAPLTPGTRVAFRLVIPSLPEPVELEAEVVRAEGEGDPGMGVRFIWTDERRRAGFESHVERLMAESLGKHTARELLQQPASRRH